MKSNSNNEQCNLLTISASPELKVRHTTVEGSPKGSIIFVHGICHGAWCFENFMNYFSENGYECFALNLRGHGDNDRKDLKGASLSNYADDVKNCIDYCIEYCKKKGITEKPFLLGHSMGGAVVQKYIGEYSEKVKGAILFASATAPRMPRLKTTFDALTKKNLRIAALKSWGINVDNKKIAMSAFFDGRIKTEKDIQRYSELLHKESLRITLLDLFRKYTTNYKVNIPILVIGSEADSYFPNESLLKTAGKYECTKDNKKKQLIILDHLCHDMMLDPEWMKAAKYVLEFMENNK